MNNNNQLFSRYLASLKDLKEILRSKNIILGNNSLKDDMNSGDN